MSSSLRKLLSFLLFLFPLFSFAQETTATLSGRITDGKGTPVEGATVATVYEPTGTKASTQTNNKGLFVLPNLKPGGPYTVAVSYVGFEEQKFENINLTLGNNPDLVVGLKNNDKALQEVVIQSARRPALNGVTIGRQQLSTLPTLGRSLSDFTRLTPQSNNNSFAGTNFRYNNVTLDGAINNDAIGFSNSFGGMSGGGQSGTAGAGTRTNPYSLDVIQEVQVQLAPYDVKLGNFTGGSVNAVTKSGTNAIHGSVYGYGRTQALVGKSVDGTNSKIGSDFHDYQWGATVGGPIVKNKAFYIFNFEQTRRQEPTFYNAGDPGAAISVADAQAIKNTLMSKYGYDVGSYDKYKIFTNSDKFFGRLDFNISPKSTLTLRGIYTNGWGNNLERTTTNFQFSSTDFTQHTKNYNLVAELKTRISNNLNNQLNVSYINVHEYRDFPGTLSPFMDIGSGAIWAGTWREASIYNMKQRTVELTDNLTFTKGINKFTFGTHNEFYNLTYGFINSWNGRWEYSSVPNFLADKPSRIRGAFTTDGKLANNRETIFNNPPNPYKVSLLSAYAQDEISVAKNFKLTPGLRLDYSGLADQPVTDPALNSVADYNSPNPTYTHTPFNQLTNKWLGKATLSPRLGFNWDVNNNQSVVVRGGTGIFTGRIPFAWLGYAYTLNGTTYGNIDYRPSSGQVVPLAVNPLYLKDTVTKYGGASASNTREVDVIDNNFKMPTIWRSNVAVDFKFGKGYKLTLDALYTKTLYDVKFQQINIKDSVQYYSNGPTQSPVYVGGKLYNPYSNVYLLTNTTQGYRYNLTAQISNTTNNIGMSTHRLNTNWSVAYTYGMSKDVANGIRNSFQSNYEVNPAIIPSSPVLSYSNFDLRHRIVATLGGTMAWNGTNSTSLAFFYSGQSGSPYSVVYASGGAPFGNAANANLPYIPKSQSDIRLVDKGSYTAAQQWADLNTFIESDSYLRMHRGQYAERNALRTPWNHELDVKLMHEFKLSRKDKSKTLQLSLDIFNVLNLLNNDWGHIAFVTNVNNYTVNLLTFAADPSVTNPALIDPVKNPTGIIPIGKPSSGYLPAFTFNKPTGVNGQYYTVDPLNSRWQGQLGVKFNF
ncbi:TonB-dependent receptor [Flavisolibacter ginsenosidimutans]|uniref:TonB-dependent receptor n=1 Tax=Flavisolibacter ginsenosidimutans TaxID=661481 RepID=A0A5B8UMB1_9BACT|nr:carboxypeptidase regulatory-like domain-containing protein [Flavisolibacter ginsenosidimutans]QEC57807.1 TonB-dependent receptor [Flavisolibacter ginsenosidimutans]